MIQAHYIFCIIASSILTFLVGVRVGAFLGMVSSLVAIAKRP